MFVQRVVMPGSRRESWSVLGEDGTPVGPVERYLAYLTDIERSPNTIKAYAHDLKDWFVFLAGRGLDWREVRLEDVGEFVAWLRLPPPAREGRVAVLPSVAPQCRESTVNRKLSALSAFYEHAARHGVGLGELLTTWQPAGRSSSGWRPLLHHISKGDPVQRRRSACGRRESARGSWPRTRSRLCWTRVIGCGTGCCSGCCSRPASSPGGAGAAPRGLGRGGAHGRGGAAHERQRCEVQVARIAEHPGRGGAGPALRRLPARGVRRAGLRLCVRQSVGRTARAPVDLRRGL